ncbi:MAG: siroheme synthase [Pedobacter sp.]|nr:MAG: siroheme synthase [Pedobacter sp.]
MLLSPKIDDLTPFFKEEKGNELFPVFVKLNSLRTLLIGGGNVGLEKLTAILNNSGNAEVTLVAENINPEIEKLALDFSSLKIKQKSFEAGDLDDADIVFAATNNNSLNELIRTEAHKKGLLINVADKPELCDFYLGSIVKKGDLKIAISTNGKSPTIAKRLKEVLNEGIPEEIDESIGNLNLIRNKLNGDFKQKVNALNRLTASLAKQEDPQWPIKKISIYTISVIALMVFGHIFFSFIPFETLGVWSTGVLDQVDSTIIYFIIGGFLAQLVDGALGMAYGVSATTFLLSFGVSPAAASASVHASEIFTSGVSGLMHLKFGNVRTKLFKKLLLPGILGAIAGAYILSSLENYGHIIKPIVSAYTLFLGVKILLKAVAKAKNVKPLKRVGPLAFVGAFLDSIGGGGWGPIVTSTLISRGGNPRYTIGSVNLTEFFVTLASSITFITMIGLTHWQIIAGLVIGGCIAAPFGAYITKKLNVKTIMIMVGTIVIITSLRTVYVLLTKL